MSARWNRLGIVTPVVLMGAALALGGCVANDISLSVTDFVGPDVSLAASNQCSFDSMSLSLARGTYDLTLASLFNSGYDANFSVQNNLPEVTTESVEMQAYYVKSFDVILETSTVAGQAIPSMNRKFSYPVATTRIAPGQSAFFSVQAIQAADINALRDRIDAARSMKMDSSAAVTIHLRPVSTRAEEEQTGAYSSFPIDICEGCLTGTGMGALPDCSAYAGQMPLVGNVCNFAADVAVTCCTKKGATVCGSPVAAASMGM